MTPLVLLSLLMPFAVMIYAMHQLDMEFVEEEPEDQGVALNPDGTLPEDL